MTASANPPDLLQHHAPSREQLIYWLHEASEIEHNLMCCYLYAAFSIKTGDPRWSPAQAQAVAAWSRTITSVAMEEMTHLCLVGNLMNALGGTAHLGRPVFPVDPGPYPAHFVIRLQPFSLATVEHFMFLERPVTSAVHEAAGFEPLRSYQRGSATERISPGARDYATVGQLYATLRQGLDAFAQEHGESALFMGDPALQIDSTQAPLPGVCTVTNLQEAHRALDTIVAQGEGAGDEHVQSHFSRFSRIAQELAAEQARDAAFDAAWPAATNPVMNPPPTPQGKVHVNHPDATALLDFGNALYTASLRCLLQGFAGRGRAAKAPWLSASFALMRGLVPVGQALAERPASDAVAGVNAGLTFTPLRTLSLLAEPGSAAFVSARLKELLERSDSLAQVVGQPGGQALVFAGRERVTAILREHAAKLSDLAAQSAGKLSGASAQPTSLPAMAASISATTPPQADPVETVVGKSITIHFEARRCIHSRHCVLEAPTVFKANTPGEWIYPDTMAVEALVEVAHRCPSGAIRYTPAAGGQAETAPPVNVLRVRENGPYAVSASLQIAGADDGFRATLCRCGQSQRKPWCDGSHGAAKFVASGEPPTGNLDPLAVRDGVLSVQPLRNGPLQVTGNLEICAGTGRAVARVTETRLCRCGQSGNKPFCDGSHLGAGFVADGA